VAEGAAGGVEGAEEAEGVCAGDDSAPAGRRRPRRRGGRERAGVFAGSSDMLDRIGGRRRWLRTDIAGRHVRCR
jgi:hypothetical protein